MLTYLCSMNEVKQDGFRLRKVLQYFLQGLLIIAPIAITFYALFFVVTSIDNLIPIFSTTDEYGNVHVQNYGLGLVVILAAILFIGYFSSFFITGRILSFVDNVLQKTPGIKHIYGTTRDFFEAFAGDKKKFTENVMVNVDGPDVWRLGFITKEDLKDFELPGHVAVYLPMSYSVAGHVYLVPREKVRKITTIDSAQTMKFAVSGGVTTVNEETPPIQVLEMPDDVIR